jgi:hypothetical protein
MIGKKMEGTGFSDILLEAGLIGSQQYRMRCLHCSMPTQMKRYLVHRQEPLVIRKNHLEDPSLVFLRLKKNKTPQKEVFLKPLVVFDNKAVQKCFRYSEQGAREVGQKYVVTTFDLGVCMKAYPIIVQVTPALHRNQDTLP